MEPGGKEAAGSRPCVPLIGPQVTQSPPGLLPLSCAESRFPARWLPLLPFLPRCLLTFVSAPPGAERQAAVPELPLGPGGPPADAADLRAARRPLGPQSSREAPGTSEQPGGPWCAGLGPGLTPHPQPSRLLDGRSPGCPAPAAWPSEGGWGSGDRGGNGTHLCPTLGCVVL